MKRVWNQHEILHAIFDLLANDAVRVAGFTKFVMVLGDEGGTQITGVAGQRHAHDLQKLLGFNRLREKHRVMGFIFAGENKIQNVWRVKWVNAQIHGDNTMQVNSASPGVGVRRMVVDAKDVLSAL